MSDKNVKNCFVLFGCCFACFFCQLTFGYDFKRAETMEDVWKASFRVETSNARGSGTFFLALNDKCYVLSNQHVVGNTTNVTLSNWGTTERIQIPGKVIWRYLNNSPRCDFSIIEVNASDMTRLNAPYVPLVGADWSDSYNSIIVSSGCPDGRFSQAWRGRVVGTYNDVVRFAPPPVEGQSGSCLCVDVGNKPWLAYILTYREGTKGADYPNAAGLGIPIKNLLDALKAQNVGQPTSDERYNVPDGWTECAEPIIAANISKWILYTQNNCAPCVAAEKVFDELKAAGIPVEKVSLNTPDGRKDQKNYQITGTPTWRLVDFEGVERERLVGHYGIKKLRDIYEREFPIVEVIPVPDDTQVEEEEDFRVQIREQFTQSGFFDSALNEWLNRGNGEEDQPAEDTQDTEQWSVFGRLFGDKVGECLDKLKEELDKTIDEELDSVQNNIDERLESYKTQVIAMKVKLAFTLFAVVIIACWTADATKGFASWLFKKLKSLLVSAVDIAKIQQQAAWEAVQAYKLSQLPKEEQEQEPKKTPKKTPKQ